MHADSCSSCLNGSKRGIYLHVLLNVVNPRLKLSLCSIHIGDHGGDISNNGGKDQDPD